MEEAIMWNIPFWLMLFLLIPSASSWAADPSCNSLPSGSISRMECERNAAIKKPESGVANLGLAAPGGIESIEIEALCGNPLAYRGRSVALRGIKAKRTIGPGSATFGGEGTCEIIVSGLPADRSFSAGEWYDLLVLPIGTSRGTNAYGATVVVPKAIYLGLP
jgi:hypothetical protein